ncbi:hypothetical protein K492DRAFT_183121 [Lichtheimia hyalospora FSU 10163]|nr:hypothetical protein K492DRAFT_183121 [Lichtheimia hyalospora FSU 10163]
MTYTKIIKLLHDAFGSSGWQKKDMSVKYDYCTQSSGGYEAGCTTKISLTIHGMGTREALSASKSNALIQTARLFGELTGNASFDKDIMNEMRNQPKPKKLKLDQSMIYHAKK